MATDSTVKNVTNATVGPAPFAGLGADPGMEFTVSRRASRFPAARTFLYSSRDEKGGGCGVPGRVRDGGRMQW